MKQKSDQNRETSPRVFGAFTCCFTNDSFRIIMKAETFLCMNYAGGLIAFGSLDGFYCASETCSYCQPPHKAA